GNILAPFVAAKPGVDDWLAGTAGILPAPLRRRHAADGIGRRGLNNLQYSVHGEQRMLAAPLLAQTASPATRKSIPPWKLPDKTFARSGISGLAPHFHSRQKH
ncbi:MAG TPA: hypothetical protein VMD53_07175, partial [Rhizomicrobium sp.]|nr:hypothetical protein [Rhizomicrobium sp.]